MRKEAITEWLQKCASRSIKKEVEESDGTSKSNKHVESVLSLLSGKEIKEACSRLQKVGEEKKTNFLFKRHNSMYRLPKFLITIYVDFR